MTYVSNLFQSPPSADNAVAPSNEPYRTLIQVPDTGLSLPNGQVVTYVKWGLLPSQGLSPGPTGTVLYSTGNAAVWTLSPATSIQPGPAYTVLTTDATASTVSWSKLVYQNISSGGAGNNAVLTADGFGACAWVPIGGGNLPPLVAYSVLVTDSTPHAAWTAGTLLYPLCSNGTSGAPSFQRLDLIAASTSGMSTPVGHVLTADGSGGVTWGAVPTQLPPLVAKGVLQTDPTGTSLLWDAPTTTSIYYSKTGLAPSWATLSGFGLVTVDGSDNLTLTNPTTDLPLVGGPTNTQSYRKLDLQLGALGSGFSILTSSSGNATWLSNGAQYNVLSSNGVGGTVHWGLITTANITSGVGVPMGSALTADGAGGTQWSAIPGVTPPTSAYTVLTANASVAETWSFLIDANISASAAIDVNKLIVGSSANQVLTTDGSSINTWALIGDANISTLAAVQVSKLAGSGFSLLISSGGIAAWLVNGASNYVLTAGGVSADPVWNLIVDANISATAAITTTKIAKAPLTLVSPYPQSAYPAVTPFPFPYPPTGQTAVASISTNGTCGVFMSMYDTVSSTWANPSWVDLVTVFTLGATVAQIATPGTPNGVYVTDLNDPLAGWRFLQPENVASSAGTLASQGGTGGIAFFSAGGWAGKNDVLVTDNAGKPRWVNGSNGLTGYHPGTIVTAPVDAVLITAHLTSGNVAWKATGGANTVMVDNNGTGLAFQLLANANISATAAILVSKLAPSATAGTIVSTSAGGALWLNNGSAAQLLVSTGIFTNPAWGQISDASIAAAAAIAVSKLAVGTASQVLTTNGTTDSFTFLVDANIGAFAGINTNKLLGSSTANQVLITTGLSASGWGFVNDINVATGANIAVSKLAPTTGGVLVSTTVGGTVWLGNGGASTVLVSAGAGLVPAWTLITDSSVSTSAAIAVSKLAAGTVNTVLTTNGTTNTFALIADANISASATIAVSKLANGTTNQVLIAGAVNPAWGLLSNASISATAAITVGKLAGNLWSTLISSNGTPTWLANGTTGNLLVSTGNFTDAAWGVISNVSISATAAIAVTKLANGTSNQVLITTGSTPTWSLLSPSNIAASASAGALVSSTSTVSWASGSSGLPLQSNGVAAAPTFAKIGTAGITSGLAANKTVLNSDGATNSNWSSLASLGALLQLTGTTGTNPVVGDSTLGNINFAMTNSKGSFVGSTNTLTLNLFDASGTPNLQITSVTGSGGGGNVGLGILAGGAGGTGNVCVGRVAGTLLDGGSNNNVMLGDAAGQQVASTSNNNTFLGYAAGSGVTVSISDVILIGNPSISGLSNGQCRVDQVYGKSTSSGTTLSVIVDDRGQLATAVSSQRYKKDIETISDSSWLQQLRPVSFRYKVGHSDIQTGFIAEEVELVNRSVINYNAEQQPDSIRYHLFTAPMVGELQRLNALIVSLTASVKALQAAAGTTT